MPQPNVSKTLRAVVWAKTAHKAKDFVAVLSWSAKSTLSEWCFALP